MRLSRPLPKNYVPCNLSSTATQLKRQQRSDIANRCAATLAVIRRETNTWRWPVFAWVYMTSIGYVGALLAFQLGSG